MSDISTWMRRVDEQLRKLGTAARANFTDVRGGFTRWKLDTGNYPQVGIGASTNATDVGIYLYDDDEDLTAYFGTAVGTGVHLLIDNDDKTRAVLNIVGGIMFTPLLATAWQQGTNVNIDTQGRPTTVSATYETLWRAYLPCTAGGISTQVDVFPGVGRTCDVRIAARIAGTVDTLQEVAAETGITTTDALAGQWAIPDAINDPVASPIGRLVELVIQARRTAGSGSIAVAPYPVSNYVI